ncbi:hypothetical protein QAD02_020814 [Eretmocerus hayati]|uniref:Uncharacterized protein n=1 Tax=Eretmocerus hayati TaxID=131215 RepID=A0ACC2PPS2_9HYME|nr:hypothetical protein QAD02_020814 [Eretmocerus hayati]
MKLITMKKEKLEKCDKKNKRPKNYQDLTNAPNKNKKSSKDPLCAAAAQARSQQYLSIAMNAFSQQSPDEDNDEDGIASEENRKLGKTDEPDQILTDDVHREKLEQDIVNLRLLKEIGTLKRQLHDAKAQGPSTSTPNNPMSILRMDSNNSLPSRIENPGEETNSQKTSVASNGSRRSRSFGESKSRSSESSISSDTEDSPRATAQTPPRKKRKRDCNNNKIPAPSRKMVEAGVGADELYVPDDCRLELYESSSTLIFQEETTVCHEDGTEEKMTHLYYGTLVREGVWKKIKMYVCQSGTINLFVQSVGEAIYGEEFRDRCVDLSKSGPRTPRQVRKPFTPRKKAYILQQVARAAAVEGNA